MPDGSGTTFTLTDYFSRVNPECKQQYGNKFTITWDADVKTTMLKKTPGTIGYAEYAYAIENSMNYAQLKNRAGPVPPTRMRCHSSRP